MRRFLSLRYIMTSNVPFEKKQDGANVSRFCDHYMVCSQNARRLSAGLNLKEIESAVEKKLEKCNQFSL